VSRADDLETMLAAAREAQAVVARVYATDFAVDYKGPRDPVTTADREANALLCDRLARRFPAVPIVAEESDERSFAGWRGADRCFFVDPLDGTVEFVSRNGEFAIMIGLAEAGRAVAGVVLAPASGVAWIGALDVGAWEIAPGGARTPIRVSDTADLAEARVVVSRSHRSERLEAVLGALAPKQILPLGSAGLKGVRVATGGADLYVQPGRAGKRWDACAPEAIVLAAGGRFTDALGEPIDYAGGGLENSTGVLVSNARLYGRALERIRTVED
jgi:3'(2'), 5'-bisphosphate nucleotidase